MAENDAGGCQRCGRELAEEGQTRCSDCAADLIARIDAILRAQEHGQPLAHDIEAASEAADLPAYLAPPPGAKPYHGFPLLPDVEVDGFRLGTITDFERQVTRRGDAFVEAPDGSRAGLLWEVGPRAYFEQREPPDAGRWGVWAVGFREPMRTHEEARANLASIVPRLREEWFRWRAAELVPAESRWAEVERARNSPDRVEAAHAGVELAMMLADEGEHEAAEKELLAVMSSEVLEAVAAAAVELGVMREADGDIVGADEAYRFAAHTGVAGPAGQAAINLGFLLADHDRPEEGRAMFKRVLEIGTPVQQAWAMSNLGQVAREAGRPAAARKWFRRAMESGQEEPAIDAAIHLGYLLRSEGKFDAARQVWTPILESDAVDGRLAIDAGALFLHAGDLERAVDAFERAIWSGEEEAEGWAILHLGAILSSLGARDRAEEAYALAADWPVEEVREKAQERRWQAP